MCFLNIKACQHILLHQVHKITIFKKASYDPFNSMLSMLSLIVFFFYECGRGGNEVSKSVSLTLIRGWLTHWPRWEGKITESLLEHLALSKMLGVWLSLTVLWLTSALCCYELSFGNLCHGGCGQKVVFLLKAFSLRFYQILPSFNVIRMLREIECEWRQFPLHFIIFLLPTLFSTM